MAETGDAQAKLTMALDRHWRALVTLIWLGGGLVALGGTLSLIGRMRRERELNIRQAYA